MQTIRQFRLDAHDSDDQRLFEAFRATWSAMQPIRGLVPEHRYLNAWITQLHQRAMFTDELLEALTDWSHAVKRHAETSLQGDANSAKRAEIDAAAESIVRVVAMVAAEAGRDARSGRRRLSPSLRQPNDPC